MHPGINSSSQLENVESAIEELISDPTVPFGEQDGNLRFFSEKLNDIERERAQIPLRSLETLRIYNEIVKEVFSPLPSARIEGSLTVKSGIRSKKGPNISKLAGERETIQTIIELVDPAEYTQVRKQIKENSCLPRSRNEIYLLGRHDPMIEEKVAEIYRSREVVRRYRNEPDQEVKDYCQSQKDRAEKLTEELTHIVSRAFTKGSLLFRGKSTAIDSLGSNHAEACNKNLQEVAKLVFDRYSEAAVRVETAVAEKFLRSWPNNITQKIDPLGLVQKHGDVSSPDTDHKALVSLCFYIDNNVSVEGRRLIDHFSAAPFGWSPDTLRYLVASLLVAGKIKLNVSGRQVTVNGQKAIEALRTNNAFKPIGVSLRDRPHDPQVLSKASKRLTDLIGEKVLPLEDEISKKATKHLPLKQNRYAPLGVQLISLGLPGKERIAALSSDIADILFTDGSEATDRLGGEQSSLYENLEWAGDVEAAFRDGLDTTLKALQEYQIGIESLPSSGIPGCLKEDLSEDLEYLEDMLGKIDFFKHTADLNSLLTKLKNKTKKAAEQMDEEQFKKVEGAKQRVAEISEWQELNHEERAGIHSQLDELITEISYDLQGIKQLINRSFDLGSKLNEIKSSVEKRGRSRRKERLQDEIDLSGATTLKETLSIKQKVTSRKQLEDLIVKLQALQDKTNVYQNMEITIITEE